jgi:hypothetical protein
MENKGKDFIPKQHNPRDINGRQILSLLISHERLHNNEFFYPKQAIMPAINTGIFGNLSLTRHPHVFIIIPTNQKANSMTKMMMCTCMCKKYKLLLLPQLKARKR